MRSRLIFVVLVLVAAILAACVTVHAPEPQPPMAMRAMLASSRIHDVNGRPNGSGVTLFSRQARDGFVYSYTLSCAHVADPIIGLSVETFQYAEGREITSATITSASLVLYEPFADLALLRTKTNGRRWTSIAKVADKAEIEGLAIFSPVLVIGCPLGGTPVPTAGHIANFRDDNGLYHVTAPVIFGNSGGGCFTSDGALIGIIARMRIARDPSGFPHPVTHFGFAIPASRIRAWLKANRYGFILGEPEGGETFEERVARDQVVGQKSFK